MSELGPRRVVDLVRAIAVLALRPEAQVRVVSEWGLLPILDELGLNFGDGAELVPQFVEQGWLTKAEALVVRELDALLTAMSESDESVWHVDSLDGSEWAEVRECAERFFVDGLDRA